MGGFLPHLNHPTPLEPPHPPAHSPQSQRTFGFACKVQQRNETIRCNKEAFTLKAGETRVIKVLVGSAAARSGLKAGDIVRYTNGQKLPRTADLLDIIHSMSTVPNLVLCVTRRLRYGRSESPPRRTSASSSGRGGPTSGGSGHLAQQRASNQEQQSQPRSRSRGYSASGAPANAASRQYPGRIRNQIPGTASIRASRPSMLGVQHEHPDVSTAAGEDGADGWADHDEGEEEDDISNGPLPPWSLKSAEQTLPPPRDYSEQSECKICFAAHKNTVLIPCGHQTCSDCAQRLRWPYSWKTVPVPCPFCRMSIKSSVQTYE